MKVQKQIEPCPYCRQRIVMLVGELTKSGYCPGCCRYIKVAIEKPAKSRTTSK